MPVAVLIPAQTNLLTTLENLKTVLGVTSGEEDVALLLFIRAASAAAQSYCRRNFSREKVREKFPAYGTTTVALDIARGPVVSVDQLLYNGTVVPVEQYYVLDKDAGIIYNNGGFSSTEVAGKYLTRYLRPDSPDASQWQIDYISGYLLPDDTFTSPSITAVADENAFGLNKGSFPVMATGERFTMAGFENVSLNKPYSVKEWTPTKISVNELVPANAPEGANITFTCRNLPYDIELAVIEIAASLYHRRDRDPNITSINIENQYNADFKLSGIPNAAKQALDQYRRIL